MSSPFRCIDLSRPPPVWRVVFMVTDFYLLSEVFGWLLWYFKLVHKTLRTHAHIHTRKHTPTLVGNSLHALVEPHLSGRAPSCTERGVGGYSRPVATAAGDEPRFHWARHCRTGEKRQSCEQSHERWTVRTIIGQKLRAITRLPTQGQQSE